MKRGEPSAGGVGICVILTAQKKQLSLHTPSQRSALMAEALHCSCKHLHVPLKVDAQAVSLKETPPCYRAAVT